MSRARKQSGGLFSRRMDAVCEPKVREAKLRGQRLNGDTDLEFSHLTVEVPRHQALAQQFHTMHLGFDAASAVVAAPSSPERTTEVFRRP